MKTVTATGEKRPFHETVVNAVSRCGSPSTGEILRLFQLIKETKLPKGHDELIAAIDKFFDFPGSGKWAREIREVKESILAQKSEHAYETKEDFDSLNMRVTSAIFKMESAAQEVSRIEEKLASITSPTSVDGDIARRGAVRSALDGREEDRARELSARFLAEKDANPLLRKQLNHMFLSAGLNPL